MTMDEPQKELSWIMIIHNAHTINYVRNTSMWQRILKQHFNDPAELPINLN